MGKNRDARARVGQTVGRRLELAYQFRADCLAAAHRSQQVVCGQPALKVTSWPTIIRPQAVYRLPMSSGNSPTRRVDQLGLVAWH